MIDLIVMCVEMSSLWFYWIISFMVRGWIYAYLIIFIWQFFKDLAEDWSSMKYNEPFISFILFSSMLLSKNSIKSFSIHIKMGCFSASIGLHFDISGTENTLILFVNRTFWAISCTQFLCRPDNHCIYITRI